MKDFDLVRRAAEQKVKEKVLSRFVLAKDLLSHFGLSRLDFNEWQYYNAIAPLTAIFEAKGDYLLYLTGDVFLKRPVSWIAKTIRFMEKRFHYKVANLVWNDNHGEVSRETYRKTWNFAVAKEGFSDQLFLVKREDFLAPIYSEIRSDAEHYPRGDVFEKRIFSYMKNHGWERIIFRRGSYTHKMI